MPNDHCPHPTGASIGRGAHGGSDAIVCCHCGARGEAPWRYEERADPDHGPYYRRRFRVDEPARWHQPTPCIRGA
jgi:hypothetical protein